MRKTWRRHAATATSASAHPAVLLSPQLLLLPLGRLQLRLRLQLQLRLPPANGVKINLIECEMKFVLTHTHTHTHSFPLSLTHTHTLAALLCIPFVLFLPTIHFDSSAQKESAGERERVLPASPCPLPPLYFAFD